MFLQCLCDLLQQSTSHFGACDFTALETDFELNFIAILQKFGCFPNLCLHVVLVNIGAQPDSLELGMFMLFCFLALFFLFVLIFTVIQYTADRRVRVGRNFDQIQPALFSDPECATSRQNTNLGARFVDNANLPGANPMIYSILSLYGCITCFLALTCKRKV